MIRKLGQVCVFYSGTGFPVAYQGKDSGELPFYKVGDIAANVTSGNTYLSLCGNYISRQEATELRGTIIPQNTVVFAKIGEALKLNRRAITSCDCLIDNNAMGVAPKEDYLRTGYFFYYMKNLRMQDHAEFTTVPSVRKSKLEQIDINIPSLDEQKAVEDRLGIISSIILKREQELQILDDLIKARFVERFGDCRENPKGWETVALEDISNVGSSKRVFVEQLQDTGIPFYRGTEVGALAEGKDIKPDLFITESHYIELIRATGKPHKGDLLMPSICPDGRIWVVDTDEPFYFKDGRVLWVHDISNRFNPVFLLYTLKDRIMTDYGSIASGTTFAEMKIFSLKQCRVFDVPLMEQNKFAAFVAQVDKSKLLEFLLI